MVWVIILLCSCLMRSLCGRYAMWSVGVVFFEIVLVSSDVFRISSLSHVLLDKLLEGWNEYLKELAYRSFMEMCMLLPCLYTKHHPNGSTRRTPDQPPNTVRSLPIFVESTVKYSSASSTEYASILIWAH